MSLPFLLSLSIHGPVYCRGRDGRTSVEASLDGQPKAAVPTFVRPFDPLPFTPLNLLVFSAYHHYWPGLRRFCGRDS